MSPSKLVYEIYSLFLVPLHLDPFILKNVFIFIYSFPDAFLYHDFTYVLNLLIVAFGPSSDLFKRSAAGVGSHSGLSYLFAFGSINLLRGHPPRTDVPSCGQPCSLGGLEHHISHN